MESLHKIKMNNKKKADMNSSKIPKTKAFIPTLKKVNLDVLLKEYKLSSSDVSYLFLTQNAKFIYADNSWELYEYNGYKYFYRDRREEEILIKDTIETTNKTIYFVVLTILLNITFLLFYLFLLKKLSPLNRLKSSILKFSKGDLNINTSSKGKDEISEVSNEFNNAINEIRTLTESRNLFLRNIMHELKTPITKGKLIGQLMEETEYKNLLKKVFERLEYLLQEFSKIEQLTSKNIELNKEEYRIIDIIDQALDILMIPKESLIFDVKSSLTVNIDFHLFPIVIKNLIDNGLKYGKSEVIVEIDENYFAIKTKGDKLEKDFSTYLQPFNRKYETSDEGLGLGFYITQNILKVHNLKLEYKYLNGQNIFFINFS
jgi:two-component system OmpR family sensor kinase